MRPQNFLPIYDLLYSKTLSDKAVWNQAFCLLWAPGFRKPFANTSFPKLEVSLVESSFEILICCLISQDDFNVKTQKKCCENETLNKILTKYTFTYSKNIEHQYDCSNPCVSKSIENRCLSYVILSM